MSPRINARLADTIKSELSIGIEPLNVANRYPEVYRSTVYRLWRNLRLLRTPYPPRFAPAGRPRLITPDIEEDLVELLSLRPTLYLDEIAYHILINFNLLVSEATVLNTLRRIDFSRKVTQRVAAQRDEVKRDKYW